MSTMNAKTFEGLAQECVMSGFRHRMLYVFVRVEVGADDDAAMVQILFDAHQPASHGMTFAAVRQTADEQNSDWNMVVVGVAKNSDDSMPSDEQAQAFLTDMREKIMIGAIGGFALLDRSGHQVEVDTEVVPLTSTTLLN